MRPGEDLLCAVHRRGWVTWERSDDYARVLMVTNAWPRPDSPTHGIFLKDTVDGLEGQGVRSDVLFIRGYRGLHCYLLGAAVMVLLSLLRRDKYKLVSSHGGETALAARFYFGAPVIASYWGSDILGPQGGGRRKRIETFVKSRLLRIHALLFRGTTTKSEEMEDVLPARARARNWVIPDGVDRDRFTPTDRGLARQSIGWPEDEVTVISVGRPVPLKRLWLAEQAASLAAREVKGLRWRLVWGVPPEHMPLCYSAADCLVHTSASEGSPNVVKEALACNLPVVATASGDIPELLSGVHPGAVCPSDPAALAQEIVLCIKRGRSNGREQTARLGLEEIAARVLACYHSFGLPC